MVEQDRYARQRLIRWWDQDRLAAARVLVAGAGALGNEVLKNLALLGVGRVLLIDFDIIEPSNLSRTVLFDETDVGRPKVEAAAGALARLNPDMQVRTINGDLFYDVGLGFYRHSDLTIGCLDNLAARAQVGLNCTLAGIPYLDGGMWSLGGEVRWFTAGDDPCFDCTLDEYDRARADERRSCSGFLDLAWEADDRVPTVATTASIIGGILAQEAAKWLCDYPISPGRAIVYNGQALTMHRAELSRNPDCPSGHDPYRDVVELPTGAAEATARQILAQALPEEEQGEGVLALGRDFLLALSCPNCGRRETVNRLWGQIPETDQPCPHCGATRRPETVRDVPIDSPYAAWPLAELGVPPGEVLGVHTPERVLLYELAGDI